MFVKKYNFSTLVDDSLSNGEEGTFSMRPTKQAEQMS
jgi:hypothetical protein